MRQQVPRAMTMGPQIRDRETPYREAEEVGDFFPLTGEVRKEDKQEHELGSLLNLLTPRWT